MVFLSFSLKLLSSFFLLLQLGNDDTQLLLFLLIVLLFVLYFRKGNYCCFIFEGLDETLLLLHFNIH